MRYFFIILILCFMTISPAQSIKVTYLERSHKDIDTPAIVTEDYFELDICGGESIFYSVNARSFQEKKDSLKRIGESVSEHPEIVSRYTNIKPVQTRIAKNYPKRGVYTCSDYIMTRMFYEDYMPYISWKLKPESREIGGYLCQMAEGELYGRMWSVWYTEDIPISDGPWLLHGLPGLILEAVDKEYIFHWRIVGLESSSQNSINLYNKGERCKRTEFLKMRKEHDEDPSGSLKRFLGYAEGAAEFHFRMVNPDGSYSDVNSLPAIHRYYYDKK